MTNPISTYRFQFNKDFSFRSFEELIPYMQKLGVGTVYASPIFEAVPGSTHGYDGVNPHIINPEIGTEEQLYAISDKLKEAEIQWLQDIVPNHMAYDSGNIWLMDVLEKGPQSKFASFFDITWTNPEYKGKLMVPFLGSSFEEAVRSDEIQIAFHNQGFVFKYHDAFYPLQPLSYATILQASGHKMPESIEMILKQLPKMEDENELKESWHEIRLQLAGLMKNDITRNFIEDCLKEVNQFNTINKIAAEQSYRLCHWNETDKQINYRRFFTVNGLICLNIQDENVFQEYHKKVNTLMQAGVFNGLRIDHIDGLYDPLQYLDRLRNEHDDQYIVVEKILGVNEKIPESWPVQGNTGYDFLAIVNNLFTNKNSERQLTKFYTQLVRDNRAVSEQIRDKKAYIAFNHLSGELDNLCTLFIGLNIIEKKTFATIRKEELREAIGEFLIQCPVYRFYGNEFPLENEEAHAIHEILNHVRRYNRHLRRAVDILENVFLKKPYDGNEELNKKIAHFYQRCMQFTGPLMAKGVEDTLMYSYNRFVAHNEVGDSPESFGISVDDFHQAMILRQKNFPLSINATSTHDTKRGEDVRARMNVLSDIPDEWIAAVKEWQHINAGFKTKGKPDVNDEYFIYQTLAGVFPPEIDDNLKERISEYLIKALREAKVNSNWNHPDESYENAAVEFAVGLLNQQSSFYKSFEIFLTTIEDHGITNSLSQLILKFTCPGVPDVYQGCELWDFSLVDPDNRRPVDFKKRIQWLEEIENGKNIRSLWNERKNGKIKLWLTQQLFKLRRQYPSLFTAGEYISIDVKGKYNSHILAFGRRHGRSVFIIVIPLHTAIISKEQNCLVNEIDWKDTKIILPEGCSNEWQDLVNDLRENYDHDIIIADLFKEVPFSILKGRQVNNERGAGILLHISSLPSAFGIGDLGPESIVFAEFLHRSRQKYWQLLPLNPTEAGQGHSPYSSISSRAGNTLLISPQFLAADGLLQRQDLEEIVLPHTGNTNYEDATRVKEIVFDKAWKKFNETRHDEQAFNKYTEQEKPWLDDYAIYAVLKQLNNGQPWYEWKDEWKFRDPDAIKELSIKEADSIQKVKWLQYIFSKQWHQLKEYCNNLGIQFIGDLPFYVSYDSVDVWSNREIFELDEEGNSTGMAGVPPDAFSADGQLWGMPVFKWEVLKENNYAWWVERLRKNMELFDSIRLDHFRAFSAYWKVPAGETTARKGEWITGPGSDFFNQLKEQLGELPFVAEDLGEIDEPVYKLRDEFNLPGMKVLQFAFGGDMARSIHIPHNYSENFIVYTGTHDNNTIRGWFTTEADEDNRLALERYVGRPLSAAEIPIVMARMAYGSVAKIVILPLQDILGLDHQARMNTPASIENNWGWRLLPGQLTGIAERNLRKWTKMYNRE